MPLVESVSQLSLQFHLWFLRFRDQSVQWEWPHISCRVSICFAKRAIVKDRLRKHVSLIFPRYVSVEVLRFRK